MDDREKMIELLNKTPGIGWSPSARQKIADHLIANCVTVRERGRWEIVDNVDALYTCSVCGEWQFIPEEHFAYCPYCGADMRGEEDGNTV